MTKCPFCEAYLRGADDRCPSCGRPLESQNPVESEADRQEIWYFRKGFIVLALCCVGPLALPLIWLRPATSRLWKVGLTILVLAAVWLIYYLMLETLDGLKAVYRFLDSLE